MYDKIINPSILIVTNKWTQETVGWNPLRAKKPSATKRGQADEKHYIDNVMLSSRKGCDFCAKNKTAVPAFGRIENPNLGIYTAANVFGYFDTVGLIIPRKHHDFR